MRLVVQATCFITDYHSPLGKYLLASSQKGVVCIKSHEQIPRYLNGWKKKKIVIRKNGDLNAKLSDQLDAYFNGQLTRFNVPLDLQGTPFQLAVWGLTCRIPYGKTTSYRQIAEDLGRPNASRAVGRAVGSNPVEIVVPCHRVLGSDGTLTGYAGGLKRKAALLELESFPTV